ncbi:putative Mor transcription activator domain-containing protein [Gammaproteobacteria bacterium]
MNEIERIIGQEAFEKLCAHYGGLDMCIPHSIDTQNGHYLTDIIGKEATEALINWGGSSRVYVPALHEAKLQKRREDILSLRERGKTIAEIAREYRFVGRYSERQVATILAKYR